MATFFVDPSINANSGSGTIGSPYGDLQYALNTETQNTGGDKFAIKAGTDEVLTAAIDLTSYGTPSAGSPLIFEGYSTSESDGGIGQIEGETNNVSIISSSTLDYISFLDMQLVTDTSNTAVLLDNAIILENCHIENKGSGHGVDFDIGVVQNCDIITNGGDPVRGANQTKVAFCRIQGLDGGTLSSGSIIFNLIEVNMSGEANAEAVGCVADAVMIQNNTIICGDTPGNNVWGIASQGREGCFIFNNYVEGFNGTSGGGIRLESASAHCLARNNYYNGNTTNEQDDSAGSIFSGGTNLGSSGVDADFEPDSNLIDNADRIGFYGLSSTSHFLSVGAVQLTQTQSGGGGGVGRLIGTRGGLLGRR